MTDDTEDVLRVLLAERAAVPALSGDPVATVQRRHRRRTALRFGAASAGAAVVVLAVVATPNVARRPLDRTVDTPVTPTVAATAPAVTPTPEPQSDNPVVRFLEADPRFRRQVIRAPAGATVRCAVDDRGQLSRRSQAVWALCRAAGPTVHGAEIVTPVDIYWGLGEIGGFEIPDAAALAKWPRHAGARPDQSRLAQLRAEVARRSPPLSCGDAASTRATRAYAAVISALLQRDDTRGIRTIYLLDEASDGPIHSGASAPLPRDVLDCLGRLTIHGAQVVVVTGHDDPKIKRRPRSSAPDPAPPAPVIDGVVVFVGPLPAGDDVEVSAGADLGGGKDGHGADFRARRVGDGWTATSTGREWVS